MEINKLAKGTIILAENYQQDSLYQQLLANEESDGLVGITLQSVSVYLDQFITDPISKEDAFLTIYQQLQTLKNQLNLLRPFVESSSFIKEIIDFHNQIHFYSLSLADLPIKSQKEQEIYLIMHQIKEIQTPEIQRFDVLVNLEKRIQTPTYRTPFFIEDIYLANKLDELRDSIPVLNSKVIQPTKVEFYKANNPRVELEGLAQLLIRNDFLAKETMIVVNDDTYYPLLQQVFSRYQIPLQFQNSFQSSLVVHKYISIIMFTLKPSYERFISLIEAECFPVETHQSLLELVQYYTLTANEFLADFPSYQEDNYQIFNINEREKLASLHQEVSFIYPTVAKILRELQLLDKDNLLDCIDYAYQLILKNSILEQLEEQQCLIEMKTILERYAGKISQFTDVETVLTYLLGSIKQTSPKNSNGVLVVDAQHFFLYDKENVIIVGCSADNYPKAIQKTGIIDEAYLAKTTFPKKEDRLSYYQQQLEQLFYLAPNLIVSYSYGDYAGKAKDVAFEVEDKMKSFGISHPLSIPIAENDARLFPRYTLSTDLAKQLFFKDGKLIGSVSSFEKFFHCPYHYFLEYGLKLKESNLPSFSIALLGRILHASLETLIKKHGKSYPTSSQASIEEVVRQQTKPFLELFPKQTHFIEVAIAKMITQLEQSFVYLAKMEQETTFFPKYMEYKFEKELVIDKNTILLKGIIDRIDENESHYRIIDYKSSNHNLSEVRLRAGLQLQLATYLWITAILFAKKPIGMYYFSFPYNTIDISAYKLSYRPKQLYEYVQEDWRKEFISNMRLTGWTFDNPEVLDFYGENITGLKYKDGKSDVSLREYDFDSLVSVLEDIYDSLWKQLENGVIDCTPTEDACLFCPFKAVCQWNGYPRVPQPISELSLKKERDS